MNIPMLGKPKNNDLTLRDRVSRLEGKMGVVIALDIGTFLAVLGLVMARALS